tara:strand:- start:673 stop:1857 length:1185 start_codon:yes stop_codon:yes gene_type:complete
MLNLHIRDNINFFEDFSLSGQEIIHLILQKRNDKNNRTIQVDLKFLVKEYPNYQKSPQSSVQEYDLIAVSDFAYLSMLKRISRSVKGNVVDNIKKVFQKDLNMTNVVVTDPCVSSFDGVLVIQSPLKAIEWLRQKAFDAEGAPFFIFPRISSNLIAITSLSKLLKRKTYKKYQYKPYQVSVPGTPESYEENLDKIINIKSNIKLDKLKQANEGAFSNKTIVTDYAKKSFLSKIFNRDKDTKIQKNKLLENSPFGKTLNFITNGIAGSSEPLTNLPDASRTLISTNTNSNSSGNPNSSTLMTDSLGRIKSYLSNMETLNHQIKVYGDFYLNPGRKIEIKVPKSCNIEEYNKQINTGNDPDEDEDKALSGLYLVAVAVHTFAEGKYITTAKIMKDQ